MPGLLIRKLIEEDKESKKQTQKASDVKSVKAKKEQLYDDEDDQDNVDYETEDIKSSIDPSSKYTQNLDYTPSISLTNSKSYTPSYANPDVMDEVGKLREAICNSEIQKIELNRQINKLSVEKNDLNQQIIALKEANAKLTNRLESIDNSHSEELDKLFEDHKFDEVIILKHVIKALDQITCSGHSGVQIKTAVLTPSLKIADQDEIALEKSNKPSHKIFTPAAITNTEFKPFQTIIKLRNDINEMIRYSGTSPKAKIDKLESEINDLKEERSVLSRKVNQVITEKNQIAKSLNDLKASSSKEMELKEAKLKDEFVRTIDALSTRIAQLTNTNIQLKENNDKLKISEAKKVKKLEKYIEKLKNKGHVEQSLENSENLFKELYEGVSEVLECPVTLIQLEEPVFTPCGHTIEKCIAEQTIIQGGNDPVTGVGKFTSIIPNVLAMKLIEVFNQVKSEIPTKPGTAKPPSKAQHSEYAFMDVSEDY